MAQTQKMSDHLQAMQQYFGPRDVPQVHASEFYPSETLNLPEAYDGRNYWMAVSHAPNAFACSICEPAFSDFDAFFIEHFGISNYLPR